jgi:hypothetical protein
MPEEMTSVFEWRTYAACRLGEQFDSISLESRASNHLIFVNHKTRNQLPNLLMP